MLKKLKKIKQTFKDKSRISQVENSDYFDEKFYANRYPDVKSSIYTPAEHYFYFGWKEGRNPSLKFDTSFYLNDNEDVKKAGVNPLFHFISIGEQESRTRLPELKKVDKQVKVNFSEEIKLESIPVKELSSEDVIPLIITEETARKDPTFLLFKNSGLFSEEYYKEHYPDVSGCPIEHFVKFGAKEGRNPSHEFNTEYYLKSNPDVAGSHINPLEHYILYGQYEGRRARVQYVDPDLTNKVNSPSILFISHEASETGAPAVLLSLMGWLKENTNINFSIIVGASGPWNAKFESIAPTFFFDKPHTEQDIQDFCGDHVQTIYVNTIAAAPYAKAFEFLHAEFVTHVHEMESVFSLFENEVEILKSLCSKYIAVSPGSVASLNKRFDKIELEYLKPFINHYKATEETQHPCEGKKIIFGCGAVEQRKGFDLFCEVANKLKENNISNVEMHWIGSDKEKDLNAQDTIHKLGVADVVKFIGPKANPRDYFKHGDLFLLTSREDPYPLVCMEAAEQMLPVVCFDETAGGMHTFVENDAGIVVPYLDISAMADAAISLITDDTLRAKKGLVAKNKVAKRHYVEVIAPQILKFIPTASSVGGNSKLDNYKALIDSAKAISFDIFDTLVTREVAEPEVVFDIAEYNHTAKEAGILSLFEERMKTAGKVLGSKQGKVDDISVDEIYENMPLYRNSSIEKQAEINVCIVHPIGKELYEYARKQGKQIYITSDMYLDRQTIESILIKNGYDHWDEFFLSSERGMKKDTGKLFKEVKRFAAKANIKENELLHIGDNWIGDIKCAREAGFNAVRFTPIYEAKTKLVKLSLDKKATLSQMGRVWDSFSTQAARMWSLENPQLASDFYTKLGFELTGPLASMMAMHTKQLADAEGVRKIVFMARDGRIIKKAFDTLYKSELNEDKFESSYLHLSRASVVGATFEPELTSNDLYFLIEGLHLAEKKISYFLNKANLDPENKAVIKKVEQHFKSVDYIPNWNDFSALSAMLESLSHEIYKANESRRNGLELYLKEQGIFDQSKVLFVDVGWLINIQSRLDRFIKSINPTTQVIGSYVGTRERVNKCLKHSSLLYDLGEPAIYSRFLEENVTLFEVLFSSPEPSAAAIIENKGKAELKLKSLGMPLPKEYVVAQKLQMGAEAYFERLAEAQTEYLPKAISKDYFFNIFEALVNNDSDIAKAELGNFEVRLGGHHEFVAYQSLVKGDSLIEYKLKPTDEYFEPIYYPVNNAKKSVLFVTSAGLTNGSTRYRSLNVAQWMQHNNIQAGVIHSQTSVSIAKELIKKADTVIFQRCFAEQGNVGKFLDIARSENKKCVGEIDDLVFPEHVASIGSVKGGEWNLNEAMFVATAYETFLLKMDSCIVSTIALKEYIETTYEKNCEVYPNRISHSKIRKPLKKEGPLKLIYASGTYSHKEDFELIEQPLYEFLQSNPEVTLSILGATQSSERILALPNVGSYPLLPYDAMLDFIAKHHVMLVPLVDDVFNNAKSNVKFVEAGAMGVPVLASNVREFESCINDGINSCLHGMDESYIEKLMNLSKINLDSITSELHTDILNKFNTRVKK